MAACPLEVRDRRRSSSTGGCTIGPARRPRTGSRALQAVLGLGDADVRVVAPDVGGGFGPKFSNYPEEVAGLGGAPTRSGRALDRDPPRMMAGCTMDGDNDTAFGWAGTRRYACRLQLLVITGRRCLCQPRCVCTRSDCAHDDGRLRNSSGRGATSTSIRSRTTPVVGLSGQGRPEATGAIERAVDVFAAAIDIDPVELRRRNLVPPTRFRTPRRSAPSTTPATMRVRWTSWWPSPTTTRCAPSSNAAGGQSGRAIASVRHRCRGVRRVDRGGPGNGVRHRHRAGRRPGGGATGSSPHGQGHDRRGR